PERPLARGGTFAQPGVASGRMSAVDVDDQFAALLRFDSGATGVIEGSRVATGHGADMTFEINGTYGAIRLNSEHVNELEVWRRSGPASGEHGWTLISTGPEHPFY